VSYDAILLSSFGGPEGLDDVIPFLERVTAGRDIPKERLAEVGTHYLTMNGVSPINTQNRQLVSAIKDELVKRKLEIPIFWGNRNSEPFFTDALRKINSAGCRKVLAITTSAYSSYSGCRQYRENLAQALVETGLAESMTIDKVRSYFDHPGFVEPFITGLVSAVNEMQSEGLNFSDIHLLFTTHSIPNSMAETSGPPAMRGELIEGVYVAQHRATLSCVLEGTQLKLAEPAPSWSLVYQSRSGAPHTPWLEPDIGDAIKELAANGTKAVIVIPIGFISDHVEVVWDLDKVASEIAEEQGLRFARVATPGISGAFVSGIVDLLEERINSAEPLALSDLGPWPDRCPIGCCPNPRSDLPAIAQGS